MKNISDRFLIFCKQIYFDKITPSSNLVYEKGKSRELVYIAKEYFKKGQYKEFAGFLQESQYFIDLWTAHLLLEFGDPPKELVSLALRTIIDYSNNPLANEVADEETNWLRNNISKYQ